ncbi:MAG TPA: energy transducer TonB [Gemmatimonadaceae bacterium]|nr:energy transducer TonB [Gemmatimonadaceae bacterium]
MLATLIESKSRRERSTGQLLVSVAAHTAIIGAALYATASAKGRAVAASVERIEWPTVYHSPATNGVLSRPSSVRDNTVASRHNWNALTRSIPIDVSRIAVDIPTFDPGAVTGTTLADLPRGNGLREPAPVYNGEAMRAEQVERQAAVAPGNLPPRYPEALRASGIEGQVVATFVISAEGRYEDGSVRFVKSDNPLFERAVQAALGRMRFVPAEIGGRKVRQLVQMPFVFTLQR